MLKGFIATVILGFGLNAMAFSSFVVHSEFVRSQNAIINGINLSNIGISALNDSEKGLPWTIGDSANYTMSMIFGKGTMILSVASETDVGFWVHQDVDMLGQKQLIEMHLNKDTGALLKLIVNGEEQAIPENSAEVVETREDTVTVPAGTFDCLYIQTKSKEGKGEAWINPNKVPVFGLIKQIQAGSFGNVTIELASFKE